MLILFKLKDVKNLFIFNFQQNFFRKKIMLFPKESIKESANSIKINLTEDMADLISDEIEYRLREVIQDASSFMTFSRREKLTVNDINNALKYKGRSKIFGFNTTDNLQFRKTSSCFFVRDEKLDLDDVINEPLPKIPRSAVLESHWLVIDGVQPQIPQNPIKGEETAIKRSRLSEYQAEAQLKVKSKHVLSKELQNYFDKVVHAIDDTIQESKNELVVKDLLEKNLKKKDCELNGECLLGESGIQQLLPYFVQFFNEQLLKEFENSFLYLKFYAILIKNKNIVIDTYLHEIIPAIISVLVSTASCKDTKSVSVDILKYLCVEYGDKYSTLCPRIINSLVKNIKEETNELCLFYCVKAVFSISKNGKEVLKKKITDYDKIAKIVDEFGNEEL